MIFCFLGVWRGIASIVGPFISTGLYNDKLAHDERCVPLSLCAARPGPSARADAATVDRAAWGRFGFRDIIVFVGVMSSMTALGGPGIYWARRYKAAKKAASS